MTARELLLRAHDQAADALEEWRAFDSLEDVESSAMLVQKIAYLAAECLPEDVTDLARAALQVPEVAVRPALPVLFGSFVERPSAGDCLRYAFVSWITSSLLQEVRGAINDRSQIGDWLQPAIPRGRRYDFVEIEQGALDDLERWIGNSDPDVAVADIEQAVAEIAASWLPAERDVRAYLQLAINEPWLLTTPPPPRPARFGVPTSALECLLALVENYLRELLLARWERRLTESPQLLEASDVLGKRSDLVAGVIGDIVVVDRERFLNSLGGGARAVVGKEEFGLESPPALLSPRPSASATASLVAHELFVGRPDLEDLGLEIVHLSWELVTPVHFNNHADRRRIRDLRRQYGREALILRVDVRVRIRDQDRLFQHGQELLALRNQAPLSDDPAHRQDALARALAETLIFSQADVAAARGLEIVRPDRVAR